MMLIIIIICITNLRLGRIKYGRIKKNGLSVNARHNKYVYNI